uniref:Uncharacterized protein n=1 Tax=Trypanosoma vivax (strain Y486) TaxID=1055687 RepID=G0UC20_TRYVY|nr:hypothetical protein TVY486_1108520 [Trypanosoma vivax Y486]
MEWWDVEKKKILEVVVSGSGGVHSGSSYGYDAKAKVKRRRGVNGNDLALFEGEGVLQEVMVGGKPFGKGTDVRRDGRRAWCPSLIFFMCMGVPRRFKDNRRLVGWGIVEALSVNRRLFY